MYVRERGIIIHNFFILFIMTESKFTKLENGYTVHTSPWEFNHDSIFRGNIAEYMLNQSHGLSLDKNNSDDSGDSESFLSHKLYIDSKNSSNFITVGQQRELTGKISNLLKTKYDIHVGDAVCLLLTNSIYLPSLHLGILGAGGVVSPANIAYQPHELRHQLKISQSKLIVVSGNLDVLGDRLRGVASKAIEGVPTTTTTGEKNIPIVTLDSLIYQAFFDPKVKWDAPVDYPGDSCKERHAYYCFSSGTSGLPKGVVTSHFNILANIAQQEAALKNGFYLPNSVYAAILPMSHIYGLSVFVYNLPNMHPYTTIVVFEKFDLELLLQKIDEHKISYLHVVPPMAVLFAKSDIVVQPKYLNALKKNLKGMLTGAAPLAQSVIDEIDARLKNGIKITQSYGLTETSPSNTFAAYEPHLDNYHLESCGWLLPGIEARLVSSSENEEDNSKDTRGEIWLRGPNVMSGYLRNPEATKASFDETGEWFKTGDVGVVTPEGQWFVVDRSKELIKSKGHQVAPTELEGILLEHPDVRDAAVIGIDLPEEGTELPRGFIVLGNSSNIDIDIDTKSAALKIKEWFDQQVSRYKQLWGGIVVIDKIPKSASGKILRRELKSRKSSEDIVYGYRTGAPKIQSKI